MFEKFVHTDTVSLRDFLQFPEVFRRIAVSKVDGPYDFPSSPNRNGKETDAAPTFDVNGLARFDGNLRSFVPARLVAVPLTAF